MNHWIKVFLGKNEDQSSNPWKKKTRCDRGYGGDRRISRLDGGYLAPGSVRRSCLKETGQREIEQTPSTFLCPNQHTDAHILKHTDTHTHHTHIPYMYILHAKNGSLESQFYKNKTFL